MIGDFGENVKRVKKKGTPSERGYAIEDQGTGVSGDQLRPSSGIVPPLVTVDSVIMSSAVKVMISSSGDLYFCFIFIPLFFISQQR